MNPVNIQAQFEYRLVWLKGDEIVKETQNKKPSFVPTGNGKLKLKEFNVFFEIKLKKHVSIFFFKLKVYNV